MFANLPSPPLGWDDPHHPLQFKISTTERECLRRKLGQLTRPEDGVPALLAQLVKAGDTFADTSPGLPVELDARAADAEDKLALAVARDAAALAAIGRAVYGALVEELLAQDGGADDLTYREQLPTHFAEYGEAAGRCDLDSAEKLLPDLPSHVKAVLRETRAYVRAAKPGDFALLRPSYKASEWERKKQRARLIDTERAALRRAEWNPQRHNTTPLHYRWRIVREMLNDLSDHP